MDLLESRRISPNMVEISQKSAWISLNLARNQLGSPRMSSNFTKYGRDLAEISLDLLESHRISPNMVEILPDLLKSKLDLAGVVGFVYYIGRVGWLKFWRRKPATQPASVESWARKPVTDRRDHWFELKSGRFVGPANLGQVWTTLPYIIISTFQPLLPSKTQNT